MASARSRLCSHNWQQGATTPDLPVRAQQAGVQSSWKGSSVTKAPASLSARPRHAEFPATTPRTPAPATASTTQTTTSKQPTTPPRPTLGVRSIAQIQAALARRVGAERFTRDLQDGAGLDIELATTPSTTPTATLVVRVNSHAAREVLERRYDSALKQTASEHGLGLSYRVQAPPTPAHTPGPAKARTNAPIRPTHRPNARQSLTNFVTGTCNRLAFDAASAVAEARLPAGVPLVLFGPCGTGKTHLLQAMCDAMPARKPGSTCRFLTAESFMSEFGLACRDNRTEGFRKKLRALDLLCIDDLQSLAHKPGMQQELQHTLDAIRDRAGRVVLAANAHPRKFDGFSDALISRLSGGMVAEVHAPDETTAGKLVWAIAQKHGLVMDENVARAIAHGTSAQMRPGTPLSVRDLEGAVTKVEAVHRLLGSGHVPGHAHPHSHTDASTPATPTQQSAAPARIGMLVVQRAMGDAAAGFHAHDGAPGIVARIGPRRPVLADQVVALVCDRLRVTMAELSGKGRHQRVVLARALATILARRCTSASYPEIARAVGRPNHSTVITAHQRLEHQLATQATVDAGDGQPILLAALIDELATRLTGQPAASRTG